MDTERALSPLEEYLYEELPRIFDQGLLKSRITAVQVRQLCIAEQQVL
jgi:hypothetical protein